jgi:tetratricopeptide (TPR) repeat protein
MVRQTPLARSFLHRKVRLGRAYGLKGEYAKAIESLQKAVTLSGGAPANLSQLGYAYGLSGHRAEAVEVLRQLERLSKRRYVSPYSMALVYVGLGERDRAFESLDKAFAEHSNLLLDLNDPGPMDSLRSDPRFADLKRRVGLPE